MTGLVFFLLNGGCLVITLWIGSTFTFFAFPLAGWNLYRHVIFK